MPPYRTRPRPFKALMEDHQDTEEHHRKVAVWSRYPEPPIMAIASNSRGKILKHASVEYAAFQIGVSMPKAYELIRQGKLRTYKVGVKGRRVSDKAIADCIALLESESSDLGPPPCPTRQAISPRRHTNAPPQVTVRVKPSRQKSQRSASSDRSRIGVARHLPHR